MMKNKIKIYFLSLFALVFTSCSDYVDGLDKSPNSPTDVPISLLMPSTQASTFSSYTGQLARMASVFTQQSTGRLFQYESLQIFDFNENDVDNDWGQIYNRGLINAQLIIDKAGDKNPHVRGMARVLKAMNLALATDYWGDVPNKEALKGLSGSFNSAFDSQESVYADVQSLLDQAIVDLSNANGGPVDITAADYIYGGDAKSWIVAAHLLKARYANRLSKKDAAGSATKALASVSAAIAAGANGSNDMYAKFGTAATELNQWFSFNNDRAGYMTMGGKLIGLMNASGDPRTSFYATLDKGVYSDLSSIGAKYGSADSPLPLVTLVEGGFIAAEANLRLGNMPAAVDAYNAAVSGHVKIVTGKDIEDPFKSSVLIPTGGTLTMEKLMDQKYIAMFTQPEVWADYRRTGLPALPTPSGAVVAGIPQRLPTAQSERLYNSKAVVVSDLLKKLWFAE